MTDIDVAQVRGLTTLKELDLDGCDSVMERFGKPKGLIRYGTQDEFAGRGNARLSRPRVVLYPIVLAICLGVHCPGQLELVAEQNAVSAHSSSK